MRCGGSSGSGAWRCPKPMAANSPLQSYFINADFAAVASDLFGERMPDQRSSGLRRP